MTSRTKAGRPPVPRLSPELLGILPELGSPRRFLILLALEQHPRTAVELQDDLGLGKDAVHYALKRLRRRGLVEVIGMRKSSEKLAGRVYGTTRKGWAQILASVAAVADMPGGQEPRRRPRFEASR